MPVEPATVSQLNCSVMVRMTVQTRVTKVSRWLQKCARQIDLLGYADRQTLHLTRMFYLLHNMLFNCVCFACGTFPLIGLEPIKTYCKIHIKMVIFKENTGCH